MSRLYLLRHAAKPIFKIGVARNVVDRSSALPEPIDYANSLQICCRDAAVAYRAERLLHVQHAQHRSPFESGDGRTEWFSLECWDPVVAYLRSTGALFDWGPLEGVPLPPAKPTPGPGAMRARFLRQLAEAARAERRRQRNELSAQRLAAMCHRVRAANAAITFWEDAALGRYLVLDAAALGKPDAVKAEAEAWSDIRFATGEEAHMAFTSVTGNGTYVFLAVNSLCQAADLQPLEELLAHVPRARQQQAAHFRQVYGQIRTRLHDRKAPERLPALSERAVG